MTRQALDETKRVKLSPRVREEIARLAKAKAILGGFTLESAVDELLSKWVKGEVKLDFEGVNKK